MRMGCRMRNTEAITTAIKAVTVGTLCMLHALIVIEADMRQHPNVPSLQWPGA